MRRTWSILGSLALPFAFALTACGPDSHGGGDDDDGDAAQVIDSPDNADSSIDATTAYPDAPPHSDGNEPCTDWVCTTPVSDNCNLGGPDICGNGLDDNCDGTVDEGCACSPGAVQACFRGPPGRHNVGGCVDGMQTCQGGGEFTMWGPCQGGIAPGAEACDSVDNDCNGCADDDPTCCQVALACPSSMPDGNPFSNYVVNGALFYSGAVTSWTWTVSGGPCDQLLQATAGVSSFTVTGANTSTLTIRPTLSGDYTVHVVIVAADGNTYQCTFIIHIRGPGLRVEQCSDRTSMTDIDLHLHRPLAAAVSTEWYYTAAGDTCFYGNCKSSSGTPPNWGYANSALAECVGGPEGPTWMALGYCRNPRLDIDSIFRNGTPENINVDVPQNNATYRVMVNYFGGSGVTHPLVNIYCGGYLRGSYGLPGPMTEVTGFDVSGGNSSGDMWRVVDVTPMVAGGITSDCTLAPLHPPGMTTGYWVGTTPRNY